MHPEGHAGEFPGQGGDHLAHRLAAPVEEGMMFPEAARPPLQSFLEVPSTVFWLPVMEWTVVIRPSLMPKASWRTLATGARAVGGAGGVGNEVHALVIGCVVHAHDEHRGIVLGRGGEKDLLGPAGPRCPFIFPRW